MEWGYNAQFNYFFLQERMTEITLEERPPYCDRGHWIAKVFGIDDIDGQDAFPRYYMNLERAKLELEEWIQWRLYRR